MADLSSISSPQELKKLNLSECETLADDIREKIIRTVSRNGGHLSSNLGAVEITLALHRVFDAPRDKIIFDVGHQTYTHKLITGRFEQFETLRTYGGISGFPRRCESEYDCFEGGHASTALSAALGYARARDALHEDYHVVAVVGDGALTGGMCYEALNDCGQSKTRMIVVLNENQMSIARNVGALSRHLSTLRASRGWNSTKKKVRSKLNRIPLIGPPVYRLIHAVKNAVKSIFVNEGFFTSLGFQYLGPIDGNDQESLENLLSQAKQLEGPVVIHCITQKGHGYTIAEDQPEAYHGTAPFLVENGEILPAGARANGEIAAETLVALKKEIPEICAVTAAMPMGTGAETFGKAYPHDLYDVGIAEEHAVTLCAGMASGGLRPFFFVYSTFLQRAYDQIIHDVCMQHLPVVFLIDRAGLTGEDGQSHQGVFDLAYLRGIPGMTVLAPADGTELEMMIRKAARMNGPCAIRYPKNSVRIPEVHKGFEVGKWQWLLPGSEGTLLAAGSMVRTALEAATILNRQGISLSVIDASSIKPIDTEILDTVFANGKPVFCLEEHSVTGGFGSAVLEYASSSELSTRIYCLGVPDTFIQHGARNLLLRDCRLDTSGVCAFVREKMKL